MSTIKLKILTIAFVFNISAGMVESSSRGISIDGTTFAPQINILNNELHLKGAALLRYLVFIKAYAGALYLQEGTDGAYALDDTPRHLVLEYRVPISARDFADATSRKIKDSVSSETYLKIQPRIQSLNRLYRDVQAGDRYSLTYIPGKGTQLIYNTTPLGTIEGSDFSRALFSIWIGDNPIDKTFRDKLVGKI
jgi:chalcone isomerase-like protein